MRLYFLRQIRSNPWSSLLALASLSAAAAANLTGCLLVERSQSYLLPFRAAQELVVVWKAQSWNRQGAIPAGEFFWMRQQSATLDGLAAVYSRAVTWRRQDLDHFVIAQYVTPGYFSLLGLEPLRGRSFSADSSDLSSVILSHRLWRGRFSASKASVGETVFVNNRPSTVVGIMPPSADFLEQDVDVWLPMAEQAVSSDELLVLARLSKGSSVAAAQSELEALHAGYLLENPEQEPSRLAVEPLTDAYLDGHLAAGTPLRPRLCLLFALLGFVLMVGCLSVAGHLAILTVKREKEMAVRFALGAGRAAIAWRLIAEGLVYAFCGTGLGVLVLIWTVRLGVWQKVSIVFQDLERGLYQPAFVIYLAGLCLICGLSCSSASLLAAARRQVASRLLGRPDEAQSPLRGRAPLGKLFAFAQISLALLIALSGCTLAYASWKIERLPLGYEPDSVLKFVVWLPKDFLGRLVQEYPNEPIFEILPRRSHFVRQSLQRIRALPGVVKVGITDEFDCQQRLVPFRKEGQKAVTIPELNSRLHQNACYKPVGGDFFSGLRMNLCEGRLFEGREESSGPNPVVINQAMADRHWPGQSALGKRLQLIFPSLKEHDKYPWSEVIAVVEDVREQPGAPRRPILYHPYFEQPAGPQMVELAKRRLTFLVRVASDPSAELSRQIRTAIRKADSSVILVSEQTLKESLRSSLRHHHLYARLLAGLSLAVLLITAAGLNAMTAFSTRLRRRELAIRVASGAAPRDTLISVLSPIAVVLLAALPVGWAGGLVVVDSLAELIEGVTPPPVWLSALTVAGVAGIVVASCVLPAWRMAWANWADFLRSQDPI